jgi:hypothetical protein
MNGHGLKDLLRFDQVAVEGTIGVLAPLNNPASCMAACSWSDYAYNNLWMLTGDGAMWRFDLDSGMWACMKKGTANYGTLGVASPLNIPPARDEVTCTWATGEDIWMFGGRSTAGYRNDLWKFSVGLNMWTWISGDNTVNVPGNYGLKGVPSPTNKPGARFCVL